LNLCWTGPDRFLPVYYASLRHVTPTAKTSN
jgi:hypothetical protein